LAAIQPGVTSALSPSFGSPASTKFWAVALAAYLPAGAPPPATTFGTLAMNNPAVPSTWPAP
ncbi:MAG: hypothetical protein ACRDF8_00740, partial [Chloroflexota bacterium]